MAPTDRQALVAAIRELSSPLEPTPTSLATQVEPLPGVRAVLFGVYGTLLISHAGASGPATASAAEAAFRAALSAGWPELTLPETQRGADRLQQAILAAQARRSGERLAFPEVDIRAVWTDVLAGLLGTKPSKVPEERTARVAVEFECRMNPAWPMPGAAETLQALRSRGLALGLVADGQFFTPLVLEALFGEPLPALGFDPECTVYSYRIGEAKPSARLLDEALAGLERAHIILADEVLYVGNDLRNDIRPATELGCRTALFAGDARSLRLHAQDPTLADVAPERIITDLRQVNDLLAPPARPRARTAIGDLDPGGDLDSD